MNELEKSIKNVNSREDFIGFMDALMNDLKTNPDLWENKTLADYLSAIQNWTEDMDGYYINNNIPIPENVSWKTFAMILMGATMYE
jgi:hypothetical protein